MSENFIKHKNLEYRVGDKFQANRKAERNGLCLTGVVISIVVITDDYHVGVGSEQDVAGWHTLDRRVKMHRGYYLEVSSLFDLFDPIETELVVDEGVFFKGRDLKGMSCKPLRTIENGKLSFVELSENVGAGGADGLGKIGYCVLVPSEKIKRKKKSWIDRRKENRGLKDSS